MHSPEVMGADELTLAVDGPDVKREAASRSQVRGRPATGQLSVDREKSTQSALSCRPTG
jgi:hypothetical protein